MIRKKFLYIVLSGFCLAVLNGCTVLGFLAGAKADTGRAVLKSPSIKKVRKIRPQTSVQIHLNDYQIVEGKFRGTEQIDSTLYLQRYNAFQSDPKYNLLFPVLNDTITLIRKSGLLTFTVESPCLFSGFDLNSISIHLPEHNRFSDEILDNMERIINRQGKNMNAQIIKSYVNNGLVPLRSEVRVESTSGSAENSGRKCGRDQAAQTGQRQDYLYPAGTCRRHPGAQGVEALLPLVDIWFDGYALKK